MTLPHSFALQRSALVRRARLAEGLTIAWMVVELAVALAAGVAARSVALTTFGVDSGIELFTALVVMRQLVLHTAGRPTRSSTGANGKPRGWWAGRCTPSSPTSSPPRS